MMVATTNGNGVASLELAAPTVVTIAPPNFEAKTFHIRGTSQYVQNRFSAKAMEQMRATQSAGSTARGKKQRGPKDFDENYEQAKHVSTEGWLGIPAPAFRNGMISACRVVGFQMTKAKLSVFVLPDGIDNVDGTPLVKITKGEPTKLEMAVKNETGVVDIRARPAWAPGWEAFVQVQWDADQFTLADVANLMMRVGMQVGIGEGRHDSRRSTGQGWGVFELVSDE